MLSTHTQQATRLQFPLKLAWSMTFHQALGQTLLNHMCISRAVD